MHASGGSLTLALSRAKTALLHDKAADVAVALWHFARLDRTAAELMNLENVDGRSNYAPPDMTHTEHRSAEPSGIGHRAPSQGWLAPITGACSKALAVAADSALNASEGALWASAGTGGAGGLNFEEYVVLRCFATASTLEEQFRFLWRLLDRDGDGVGGDGDGDGDGVGDGWPFGRDGD